MTDQFSIETKTFRDRTFSGQDIIRIFINNLDQSEQWQVGKFIMKWYDLLPDQDSLQKVPDLTLLVEDTIKFDMDVFDYIQDILTLDWDNVVKNTHNLFTRGFDVYDRWMIVWDNWDDIFPSTNKE